MNKDFISNIFYLPGDFIAWIIFNLNVILVKFRIKNNKINDLLEKINEDDDFDI